MATGSPEKEARLRQAKLSLDKLAAAYAGDSPWGRVNKQNALAIERATQIVAKLRKAEGVK